MRHFGQIAAARPQRNDPCPCGSGRKFKLCCGATRRPDPVASAATARAGGMSSIGPLTAANSDREAAERFLQIQSAPPAGLFAAEKATAAATDVLAAERQRQHGDRLFDAGRLTAAISAFREAIRLDPGDAKSHHSLGRALLRRGHLEEAADSLRLATTLADDAPANYDLGVALRRQRRDVEAMAAYRRAVELAPDLAEAHVDLAELHEDAGEDEEAAASFRRAAASAPETIAGRLSLGRASMLDGDFQAAEARLRQVVALDPANGMALKLLGDALARQGRFAEAIVAFDRVVELNPFQAWAHFAAVEAQKCTEADRPRLARMRSTLEDASLTDDARTTLHFAIGKLLDDLGEYGEAMFHFDAGNRIGGRHARFDGPAFAADVDRLTLRFTPDFFAANTAFGRDDETPLLIVGMPRSGTTLVERILSRHPRIAAGGELPFWFRRATPWGVTEATYLTPELADGLSGEYLSLLRRIGPGAARVTDKLPFNLIWLGVIHLLLPKARIVQCRRHPVDTCLSIYFTHFKQTIAFANDKTALVAAYRQYARLMDHWRAVLPPDRLLEIDYERLVTDREAETRRMIDFAGLDWDDACLEPERNDHPVTTASLWQARQPVYASSLERWRHYQPWLGELRRLLSPDEARSQTTL